MKHNDDIKNSQRMPRLKRLSTISGGQEEQKPLDDVSMMTQASVISVKLSNLATMVADLQAEWAKFKHQEMTRSGPSAKAWKTYPGEPKAPKTPLQLFMERKLKDKEITEEMKKKYKNKFNELPEEKMVKWIGKALDDLERHKQEVEVFRDSNPLYVPRTKATITVKERLIYDRLIKGRPDPPPRSAYILFCRELKRNHQMPADPRDQMRFYSSQWAALKPEDVAAVEERLTQSIKEYIDNMAEYLKKQPIEERKRIKAEEPRTMPDYFKKLSGRREKRDLTNGIKHEADAMDDDVDDDHDED